MKFLESKIFNLIQLLVCFSAMIVQISSVHLQGVSQIKIILICLFAFGFVSSSLILLNNE